MYGGNNMVDSLLRILEPQEAELVCSIVNLECMCDDIVKSARGQDAQRLMFLGSLKKQTQTAESIERYEEALRNYVICCSYSLKDVPVYDIFQKYAV